VSSNRLPGGNQLRRMWTVAIGMSLALGVIVLRLFAFQVVNGDEWKEVVIEDWAVTDSPERGVIYDHNGAVLAVDEWDYRVGVSPAILTDAEELANQLAPVMQIPRGQLLAELESPDLYVVLAPRVSSETAEAIRAVEYGDEVQLDPPAPPLLPARGVDVPHPRLCRLRRHGRRRRRGVLPERTGRPGRQRHRAHLPLLEQTTVMAREGADLVLTIDRSVQYTVERHLKEALAEHGAVSGSIIVMDPRTGAIVAMAAEPCYSANDFYDIEESLFYNPLVSAVYEPGSS
jgi:cell division protein FtsI/penicillin-binding protein 2